MNLFHSFTISVDQSISNSINHAPFDVSMIRNPLRKIQKLTSDIAIMTFAAGVLIFLSVYLARLEDRFFRWIFFNRVISLSACLFIPAAPYLLTGAKIFCLVGVTAAALWMFESALKAGLDMISHFRQMRTLMDIWTEVKAPAVEGLSTIPC